MEQCLLVSITIKKAFFSHLALLLGLPAGGLADDGLGLLLLFLLLHPLLLLVGGGGGADGVAWRRGGGPVLPAPARPVTARSK